MAKPAAVSYPIGATYDKLETQMQPTVDTRSGSLPQGDLDALMQEAFIYAFPAFEIGRLHLARRQKASLSGPQDRVAWMHARKLCSPTDRWVTTPNNDTLYSVASIDLSSGPVLIRVPEMGRRYYSLAFIDAFTNNFAMVGSRVNGGQAGEYILCGPDWQGALPTAERVIMAPGNDVLILARTLVDGDHDLPVVHALQDAMAIERIDSSAVAVASTTPALPENPGARFVDVVGEMLIRNPPPRHEALLLERLKSAGIDAGARFAAAPSALQSAWTERYPQLLGNLKGGFTRGTNFIDGWLYPKRNLGNFGTDYLDRARIALEGLLALEPVEALYPATGSDSDRKPLTGANRYQLHLPPSGIPVHAFWSLSIYEVDPKGQLYFTENPIHRYAIGDRTPGLEKDRDGGLTLAIAHERPDRISNWLPAPRGDFRLVLRAYQPKSEMLDGVFRMPAVERV